MLKISIKILGVNFGNSILDKSKWDKISDGIAKKIHIWKRVRLSLIQISSGAGKKYHLRDT